MITIFIVLSTDKMDSLDNNIRVSTKCYWKINGTIKIYLPTETQQQIRAHGVEHRQKRLQEIADGHITSLLSCKIPQPKLFA